MTRPVSPIFPLVIQLTCQGKGSTQASSLPPSAFTAPGLSPCLPTHPTTTSRVDGGGKEGEGDGGECSGLFVRKPTQEFESAMAKGGEGNGKGEGEQEARVKERASDDCGCFCFSG